MLLTVLFLKGLGAEKINRHVLYISSYHPGYPAFFQQIEGVKSVFKGAGIAFDVEFMDAKRYTEPVAIKNFARIMAIKYKDLSGYDAVIVADDAALRYAVKMQNSLFRNMPVFFCGINDLDYVREIEKQGRMKGTVEAVSMKETLLLMREFFPARRSLAVISDSTITGRANLSLFNHDVAGMGFNVKILSLESLSFAGLNQELDKLGDDAVILLLAACTDRTGATRLFEHGLVEIMNHTKQPVFHIYEYGLGEGVFGGRMVSHFEQGAAAAGMVLKFFQGVPMGDIPVMKEGLNRYMFDYDQLKRFDVSTSALPDESIVINRPHSFIEIHPQATLGVGLSVFFLTLIIALQFRGRIRLAKLVERRTDELLKSRERLQAAMKNANQIIWEWDILTNDFLLISPRDDVPGSAGGRLMKAEQWRDRMHPDDRVEHDEVLRRYLAGEIPSYEALHRIYNFDDELRWFITRGRATERDSSGRAVRMSGISTDITRIKDIEKEIKASKAMMQLILDTIPMGVFWKDTDLLYTGCNNVFARIAMVDSPADVVGRRDSDMVWKEQADIHEGIDREVIATGRRKGFYEEVMVLPSGETMYMRKAKVPLSDTEGRVIGILGVLEDVTEARRMREQRIRAQKLESVGILAGGMAHDFNNMLMGISGSLSVLRLLEKDDKKLHWIGQAEKACGNASEITSRLITFARGGDPVLKAVNIAGLIRNTVDMDNSVSDLPVECSIQLEMPPVLADERQISQVIRNLLENAREATASGGSISVRYAMASEEAARKAGLGKGAYVHLTVTDTGAGIEPDVIGKIFDPYFSTKNMGSQKGQGLGLTVCHSIVKNHEGVIWAESVPGEETVFSVLLPVAAD